MIRLLRPFRRQALFAAINLIGLAIGVAGFLFVALYVKEEFSYDRHYAGAERIYRVTNIIALPGRPPMGVTDSAPAMAALLRQEFPEVEATTRVQRQLAELRLDQERSFAETLLWADANLFDVLDFPFAHGDAGTALAQPDGLVLTAPLAAKLFGEERPIGRRVELADGTVLTVTGVLKPLPPTHLDFTAIVADAARGAESFDRRPPDSWSQGGANTYVRLEPGADPAALRAAFPDFVTRHATGLPPAEMFPDFLTLRLDPVADIHLRIKSVNDPKAGGTLTLLTTLAGVAALILDIAIVNYANLSTAQAIQRAKEVGVRKVAGAKRRHLVAQFLGESVVMSVGGTLLALGFLELSMPAFNALVDRDLSLWRGITAGTVALMLATPLAVGLLGGVYPALVLSGYRPAEVLKGKAQAPGSNRLRGALVVLQFAISIALVIVTLTVRQQVEHARTAELGYMTDGLVFAGVLPSDPVRQRTLRNELAAHPGIEGVTFSSIVPSDKSQSISSVQLIGVDHSGQPPMLSSYLVAPDFFDIYGIRLIAGPGVPPGWEPEPILDEKGEPVDTPGRYAYLSRSGLARLGFATPEEAVGKLINGGPDGEHYPTEIVGVVEDIRLRTARDDAEAILFTFARALDYVTVKLAPGDPRPALDHLDAKVEELFPDRRTKRRYFVDERLEQQYQGERRQAAIFATFAGLAILLANMGLFGLTALAAARRTKEIGIRRVVGASVPQVVLLLARNFTRPVLLANLIAWPVAWLLMARWLEQFTVRIELGPLPFLLAGAAALLVAVATVSLHAARVALSPPARSLRYE